MTPTSELHFRSRIPEGVRDGSPLLVLLHGRGSNEEDLQGLAPFLPPDAILITPRAPFPSAPWGYGPGWAWYRYAGGNRVEDETLEESLLALDRFLERLETELSVSPGPRILGGFSQGGTTALAWALSRPGKVDGVVMLSGFLVDSPLVELSPRSAGALPVFWGHGQADPAIPFAMGADGRRRLEEAGALLETMDHPGGHTLTSEELKALRVWVDAR